MSQTNNLIFKALHVVAWIIFVGLCIEACGFLVNFIISLSRPEWIPNLYQKLDLSDMYNQNLPAFYGVYSFILFIAFMKAYLFYVLIRLLSKLDLSKPFNSVVSGQIMKISSITLSIGLFSYVANQLTKNLQHHGYFIDTLHDFWQDSQAFVLMSAVIYVIATIFKKGVELQNENDLTV